MADTMLMMAREASSLARMRRPDLSQSRLANARPAASPRSFPLQQQQQPKRSRQVGKASLLASVRLPKPPVSLFENALLIEHCQPEPAKETTKSQIPQQTLQYNEAQQQKVDKQTFLEVNDNRNCEAAVLDAQLSTETQTRLSLTKQQQQQQLLPVKQQPSVHCLAASSAPSLRRGGVNRMLCSQLAMYLTEAMTPTDYQQQLYHSRPSVAISTPFQFDSPSPDDRVMQSMANRSRLEFQSSSATSTR